MSPDQPAPALACAALLDLAREAFSGGAWRAFPGLGQAYGMVLAAYASTREWEKWADPQDQRSYGGHWYLLAWMLLPALLWLADITNIAAPSWPDSLNSTLAYVMAAYAGSKASARWRGLTRGTFARARSAAPVPAVLTTDQYLTRHALRLGSMLLGAACLWDASVEGLSGGAWIYTGKLYVSYGLVLSAYCATREWEKWTDPLDQDAYWGNWFVLAWCILPFVIWFAGDLGVATVWPSNMNTALGTVLAVFAGAKASGHWRAGKVKEGWGGAPGAPLPDVPQDPTGQFAEACRRLAVFSSGQIAAETGLDVQRALGFIGLLVGKKSVRREGKDRYRWVGP
ncbi:MAG: hypothetical protein NTY77_11800 [Elusimicrobia bacterium]|nr:hypothetical protein [Elusimicrobiota bacterium]